MTLRSRVRGWFDWFLCDFLGAHKLTPTRNLVVGGQVQASEETCQRCGAAFVTAGRPDAFREIDTRDAMDQARMNRERCQCAHIRAEHSRNDHTACLVDGCDCSAFRVQGFSSRNTTPRGRA